VPELGEVFLVLSRRSLLRCASAVALFAAMPIASFAAWPRSGHSPPPGDNIIPVSTEATGNYSTNAFPGFTTPATRIFASGGQNYISPNPDNGLILATAQTPWRDMEITSWTGRGAFYLRMANGRALVFYSVPSANSGAGLVQIGIVENFVPESGSGGDFGGTGNFYWYYINENPAGTLAGYSGTYSSGNTLTFGCSGFNVYLKINGTLVYSYTEWRLCQPGVAALWTHQSYGATDIHVHYLSLQYLYSRPNSQIYDPRDFGMRALAPVTGSMSASSNQLVLASEVGFAVGDQVIVEIGGESGGGLRGSIGVGGNWPILKYASLATMNADTSQPDHTSAYLPNMLVYTSKSKVWTPGYGTITYYPGKVVPLSLVAKVTAITSDGKTLTLNKNAAVATNGANVWLDCLPSFLVVNQPQAPAIVGGSGTGSLAPNPSNMLVSIPAGSWRLSNFVTNPLANLTTGLHIYGQGRTQTTLNSPKGVTCAAFQLTEIAVNNIRITDMAYVGNFGDNGFGFEITANGNGFGGFPSAFSLGSPGAVSTGLVLQNIDGTNTFGRCCGISGNAPMVNKCTVRLTSGQLDYVGWQMQCFDSANPVIQNCTGTAPYTMKCFEVFACNGGKIINCGGQNTIFSTNSSTNTTIDLTQNVTFTAGCWINVNATGIDEPIFNINDNAFGNGSGGVMICRPGFQCIQQGYIDGNHNTLKFVQIQAAQTGWTIQGGFPGSARCSETLGGFFQTPDYNAASDEYGAMLIYSDAADTVVTGLRIKGAAIGPPGHSGHFGNISLLGASSSVSNCIADTIQRGPTRSRNQTNAAYRGC
jgi:hypothetical protein